MVLNSIGMGFNLKEFEPMSFLAHQARWQQGILKLAAAHNK